MFSRSFFQRPAPDAQSRASRRRQRKTQQRGRLRDMRLESLEDRRVLAVLYVANDSGFTVTNDTAPPGLSAGDTVTWNGGGQFSAVQNLTFGTNAFDSINAAISAANSGDTIDVAPGTYSEQVNINKSITLLGGQHGVDAQGGRASASESILDATNNAGKTQLVVGADDVTVDGFTIQNETNTNQFGAAIFLQPGHHGTHVINDIVQNNQIGLYLANDSTIDQAVIQHDLFQNNNQAGPGAGTAIYTDQFVAGGAVTDVLIDSNKIAGNNNAGVALSGTDPTKPASDITISNNVIDSNGRGIYAYATTSSTITGNDITNSTTPTDGGTSVAIGLFGSDNGITISGNKIENGALRGIRILTDTSTPGITANQNITINDNAVFGFSGGSLVVESGSYTGTLDASKNWWGTNNATTIQSDVSGSNVAFSPYLDSGTNSIASGPGFQGDQTKLDATNLGAQVGGVGAIQAAVNAASPGATVTIQPGTYDEKVTVNKPLTLLGAQHGVDARSGRPGAAESIVDGADLGGGQRTTSFYVTANDVTIDGFTIENATSANQFGAGVLLGAGTSGAHVLNNIFQNNIVGLFLSNASATDQAVIKDNLFQNNNAAGPSGGTAIYSDQFVAGGALNDVLIDSNEITGNSNAGIGIATTDPTKPASNLTISNNTIDSNGRGIYLFDTLSSTITGNDITNDTTPTDGGTSVAIGIDGDDNGVTITNNNIHSGVADGIHLVNENINANQNVTINDNSITGFPSGSVVVDSGGYTGTLDATKNWWGTNDAGTIAGEIKGTATPSPVQFSPYLDSGTNSVSSGPGFQGDLTHLDVASNGQGQVGPIEQAILATPAGGTVTIQAGTYVEGDVVINKNITLQGVGNVVLQAPTPGVGTGVTITGNPQTVTIDNITVNSFHSSLSDDGGNTLSLTDLKLKGFDPFGSATLGPDSPISNVNTLNLTATTSAPQTVAIVTGTGYGNQTNSDGTIEFFGEPLAITNIAEISAVTGAGSDNFGVTPFPNTTITIDAGDPRPPAKPGDALNMKLSYGDGASLAVTNGPSGVSGAWTFTNAKPVNFSHIETLSPLTGYGLGNFSLTATEGVATGNVVVGTFTDTASGFSLSDYSADINWGDGTSSTGTVTYNAGSNVYSVSGDHTYVEDSNPAITGPAQVPVLTITVHRTGSPDLIFNGAATVVEPSLTGTGTTLSGNEFTSLTNRTVATFTHGNNSEDPSTFTATIDWGDGTSSAGTVSLAGGIYSVAGSHTYSDEGSFAVKVKINDDTAAATIDSTTTVAEELMANGQPGTTDQRLVSEAFRDLLHRAADSDGLAYWSGKLDGGMTRTAFIADIQNSDEYRGDQVDALYVKYLHRHADPGGLANGIKLFEQGETPEQLAAMLVNSDEYLTLHAGGNDAFLSALFSDALGRPIDAAAKTHFDAELTAGATHAEVADEVFASAEYRTDVVRDLFRLALDRTPDSGGSGYFADQLAHGKTDDQVLAEIMSSPEYLDRISPTT